MLFINAMLGYASILQITKNPTIAGGVCPCRGGVYGMERVLRPCFVMSLSGLGSVHDYRTTSHGSQLARNNSRPWKPLRYFQFPCAFVSRELLLLIDFIITCRVVHIDIIDTLGVIFPGSWFRILDQSVLSLIFHRVMPVSTRCSCCCCCAWR